MFFRDLGLPEADVGRCIAERDTNQDGYVSFEEFVFGYSEVGIACVKDSRPLNQVVPARRVDPTQPTWDSPVTSLARV